jgi:O-antigen ligase
MFTISIYLPMIFTNILSILLVLFMIINYKNIDFSALANNGLIIAMSTLYFLIFLGFFYNIESEGVLNDLEKKSSFLILPIAVCVIKINKQDVQKILTLFFFSGFFFTSIAFCISIYNLLNTGDFNSITNHEFSESINLHATYLSMYLLFSMVYPLLYLNTINSLIDKLIVVLLSIFIIIYILLLSARVVWVLLFIILITQGIRIFRQHKIQLVLSVFGMIFFSGIIIYSVPPLKERFKEVINYNNQYNVSSVWKNNVNEVWGGRGIRLLIWQSCADLIKETPISGFGSSREVQKQLNNIYLQKKIGPLLFLMNNRGKVFNPHNQYLEEILKFGVFLGAFYLIFLVFSFIYFFKKEDKNGIYFILIIFGVSFTETILELNKGIVFFSFFFAILYSYIDAKKDQEIDMLKDVK